MRAASRWRLGGGLALLAAASIAASVAPAQDRGGRKLRLKNPTGEAVIEVYLTPSGTYAMSADALEGRTLKPGGTRTLDLSGADGCLFDLSAIAASGEVYTLKGVDICQVAELNVGDRGLPVCPGDPRCRKKKGR